MKKLYIFLFDEAGDCTGFSPCEVYLSNSVTFYCNHSISEHGIALEADKACFIKTESSAVQQTENVQWISLSTWDGSISGNVTYTKSIADTVHALMDNLPKFGVQLEVVWVRDTFWPELGSNLSLFGELKCLSCWHNAHILLAAHSIEEDTNVSAWANVLSAEKLSVEELKESRHLPLWSGPMKMHPNETEDAVVFPGFLLFPYTPKFPKCTWKLKDTRHKDKMEDIFYQDHLDFLALVNIRNIPAFYITSSAYEVCIKSESRKAKKSKKVLNHLLENEHIGYIVRLTSSTSWKTKKREQSIFKNTNTVIEGKSWIDAVLENANCPFDPSEDIELDGDIKYFHFLLCKSESRSTEDKVLAYHLRNPRELSGRASQKLAELQIPLSGEVEESLLSTANPGDFSAFPRMNDIPYYDTETWLEMEDRVREAQWKVLHEWAEHQKARKADACLDVKDLYFLLGETRRVYINQYKELFGDYNTDVPRTEPLELRPAKPEHENLYNQLERMVLMYNNSLESKLARFKSSDSLAGLSPPGQVLKLNAEEFLKHFTKEGKPKKENLSTLTVKKTRMNKFDSGELNKSVWPDCSHFKYHDIYYNVGSTPEKLEQKSVRLKTKLHYVETSSTCNAKQARSPQTIAMKDEVKSRKSRTSLTDSSSSLTPTGLRRKSGQLQKTPQRSRKRSLSSDEMRAALYSGKRRKLQTPPKVLPVCDKVKVKSEQTVSSKAGKSEKSEEKPKPESRSQRHKRKLEAAVAHALETNGVTKAGDKALYKACFRRLYLLSYSFVKDLRDYSSLTQEMEKITTVQAPTVIHFERSQHNKK